MNLKATVTDGIRQGELSVLAVSIQDVDTPDIPELVNFATSWYEVPGLIGRLKEAWPRHLASLGAERVQTRRVIIPPGEVMLVQTITACRNGALLRQGTAITWGRREDLEQMARDAAEMFAKQLELDLRDPEIQIKVTTNEIGENGLMK